MKRHSTRVARLGGRALITVLGTGLLALALAACSSGGGGGGGSTAAAPAPAAVTSVSLAGTMNTTGTAALHQIRSGAGYGPLWTTVDQLALYCVTFTAPPNVGTGAFDASGQFSVTVANAANVPVGCFIVDTSAGNAVVTTLTFNVGGGGLGGANSSGASFAGGSYAITINFNSATNTATADVSSVATPPSDTPSFTPAAVTGEWNLVCHVPDTATSDLLACMSHMPAKIFIDLLTATANGTSQYALGLWGNEASFVAAGKTEGMHYSAADFASKGVTAGPTSLLPNSGNTAGANPTLAFIGFTSYLQTGGQTSTTNFDGKYDFKQRKMLAQDAWTFLLASGSTSWASGGNVSSSCNTAANGGPLLTVTANLTPTWGQATLSCLLTYLENARGTNPTLFVPQIDFQKSSDVNSNPGYANVFFRGEKVADAPILADRFALMGASLSGSSVLAHQDENESWMDYNPGTHTSIACTRSHAVDIVLVVNSATSATGYITVSDFRYCGGIADPKNGTNSFRIDMSKGTASIQVAAFSGTAQPLDGKWLGCRNNNLGVAQDQGEAWMVAGTYITVLHANISSTDGSCSGTASLDASGSLYGTVSLVGPVTAAGWSDGSVGPTSPGPARADAGGNLLGTPVTTRIAYSVTDVNGNAQSGKALMYMDDSNPLGSNPDGLRLYTSRNDPGTCVVAGEQVCLDKVNFRVPLPQN